MTYWAPRLLSTAGDVEGFRCRSAEQTQWIQRHAKQSAAASTTKVLVVTETDSDVVVARYAWAMAQIELSAAPARLTKGAGRYPQPVTLLARLGVDERHERHGRGAGLLVDAITRLILVGREIGCRDVLIHAENDTAQDFCTHLVPELEASPTDPRHLILLLRDVAHTLGTM